MIRRPPRSTRTCTLFPYTTLFRAIALGELVARRVGDSVDGLAGISANVVEQVGAALGEIAELVEVELADVLQRVAADVAGEADHRLGDVASQVQAAVDDVAEGIAGVADTDARRTAERGVGTVCVSPGRSRWSPRHKNKKN